MSLRVFGLTGGIGSGKSTVSRHFRARGVPVLDADQLAREVVQPGQPALDELRSAFGAGVLLETGSLDRAALGRIVFGNPAELARLEAILHPKIRDLAAKRFAELEARGVPLAGYEVPLLFEKGLQAIYRPVVLVSVPPDIQVARASQRDLVSAEAIRARIAAQMPLEAKAAQADYVIDNSGELSHTLAQADTVLEALRRSLGIGLS